MPGIAGIFAKNQAPEATCALVQAMLASMQHEPTYVTGTCEDPQLGLYAGWVAHGGSFAAQQSGPANAQGLALAFAGECFEDAPVHGARLRDRYAKEGDAFVSSLNGLFSGLLIDTRQHRALLFNDRYGIERLYWHETPDALYFASEAKALLRVLPALRAFDDEGVAQFLAYGCTLDHTHTFFRNTKLTGGGCLWTLSRGRAAQKDRYFSPESWENQEQMEASAFLDAFEETLRQVTPKYFCAPEDIGIALTGGLDTRMVLAFRPSQTPLIKSYTYVGRKGTTRDATTARQVADTCGFSHDLIRVQPDFLSEYRSHFERTVFITDGYLGATGAHEIYLNAAAKKLSPIRLTGVFGSEILRGVSTFKSAPPREAVTNPDVAHRINQLISEKAASRPNPVTFSTFHEIPYSIFGSIASCRSQVVFRTPFLDNTLVALAYRIPPALRSGTLPAYRAIQNNAPDLFRVPTDRAYLGHMNFAHRALLRLWSEFTFKLDYYYNDGMPGFFTSFDPLLRTMHNRELLFGQHKYLHYRQWFRRELADFTRDTLAKPSATVDAVFGSAKIASVIDAHVEGKQNYTRELSIALTLQSLESLLFRNQATSQSNNLSTT